METDLMSVDGVINAVKITGVLLYFLSPTLLAISVVYLIRRAKIKADYKRKLKMSIKEQEKQAGQEGQAGQAGKSVDETSGNLGNPVVEQGDASGTVGTVDVGAERPERAERFRSLALEFDENGRAI